MRKIIGLSIQEEEEKKLRKLAVIEGISISEYIRTILKKYWNENKNGK